MDEQPNDDNYEAEMDACAAALARIVVDRINRATAGMPPGRLTTAEIVREGARRAAAELEAEWQEAEGAAGQPGERHG